MNIIPGTVFLRPTREALMGEIDDEEFSHSPYHVTGS